MTRLDLITQRPFAVRVLANGRELTAESPLVSVRYLPDGTGTRTLRDGSIVAGQWRFLDEAQRTIEVAGPEGTSRWIIVELSPQLYRKVNLETGLEFIHIPQPDRAMLSLPRAG